MTFPWEAILSSQFLGTVPATLKTIDEVPGLSISQA